MTTPTFPVHPMNEEHPLTFPTKTSADLSADARTLLAWLRDNNEHRLDRDIFDPTVQRAWLKDDDWKAFRLTERMQAAVDEVVAARLGSYSEPSDYSGPTMRRVRLSKTYTVAYGTGPYLIEVRAAENGFDRDGVLVAVLVGANVQQHGANDQVPYWSLVTKHETALDEEHDTSSTAVLTVLNPTFPTFGYSGASWSSYGLLSEARTYPLGTDPVLLDARDGKTVLPEPKTCDGTDYHGRETHEPHPFAPYQPPEPDRPIRPVMVRLDVYPIRPYMVAAPDQAPEQ